MSRVCSWCNKHLGEVEPKEDVRITHGICESCSEQFKNELKWRAEIERLQSHQPKKGE